MPGHPSTMLHRTREEELDLRAKSQMFWENETQVKPPRARESTKTAVVATEIYNSFVELLELSGNKVKVPATSFNTLNASRITLMRAKKMLGIKSIRKAGTWWWTFPRYSPKEALDASHIRRIREVNPYLEEMKEINRPAAQELSNIMKENNYVIRNIDAIERMRQAGYARMTVLKFKAQLGIASRKINGTWMWYWPNREVQDWLLEKLESGPVPIKAICIDAFAEHNWPEELMYMCKKALPQVTYMNAGGIFRWMDINHPSPVKQLAPVEEQRVIDVDNLPELDDFQNMIIVDFSEDENPPHELAPETTEPTPETEAKESTEVVVNGIKIETWR